MPELGNEYEVTVSKHGDIDHISLKVEVIKSSEGELKRIESKLKTELRLKTNLGYEIQIFQLGTLPRYEVKAKRFKDLRKKG
jgi:phenylacetate-CoA ligase